LSLFKTDKKNEYIKMLSKRIFWDINTEKLDYWRNRQTIIERIAVYGRESDEKIMNLLYSPGTIKKCLKKSDSLNEKVIRYYAFLLHEKESRFKCYAKIPVQMSC